MHAPPLTIQPFSPLPPAPLVHLSSLAWEQWVKSKEEHVRPCHTFSGRISTMSNKNRYNIRVENTITPHVQALVVLVSSWFLYLTHKWRLN